MNQAMNQFEDKARREAGSWPKVMMNLLLDTRSAVASGNFPPQAKAAMVSAIDKQLAEVARLEQFTVHVNNAIISAPSEELANLALEEGRQMLDAWREAFKRSIEQFSTVLDETGAPR